MLCVPIVIVAAVLAPLLFVVLLAQVVDPDVYPLGALYLLLLPFALLLCLPLLYIMRRFIMAPRRAAETFIVGTNKEMVPKGLMISFDKRTDYCSASGMVYTSLVFYVDTSLWTEVVPSVAGEQRPTTACEEDSLQGDTSGGTKKKKAAQRDYRVLQEVDPWA